VSWLRGRHPLELDYYSYPSLRSRSSVSPDVELEFCGTADMVVL
jgi:hypothetical protein